MTISCEPFIASTAAEGTTSLDEDQCSAVQTSESAREQKIDAPSLQRQTSEPAVPRGRHTRSEVEAVRLWGAETAAGRKSLVQTEAGSSAEAEVQETRVDHTKGSGRSADLDEAEHTLHLLIPE